jgi:hypothetical protein
MGSGRRNSAEVAATRLGLRAAGSTGGKSLFDMIVASAL